MYVCNLFGVDVYFLDGVLIYLLSSMLGRGWGHVSPPLPSCTLFLFISQSQMRELVYNM